MSEEPVEPTEPEEPTDPEEPPPPDDEEYIPIEVVPPPEPVPAGDAFLFQVDVSPAPPSPETARAVATKANTVFDVDVFILTVEGAEPTMRRLNAAEEARYFEYLEKKLRIKGGNPKTAGGKIAENAPPASLVLVVSSKKYQVAVAGAVNVAAE